MRRAGPPSGGEALCRGCAVRFLGSTQRPWRGLQSGFRGGQVAQPWPRRNHPNAVAMGKQRNEGNPILPILLWGLKPPVGS